MSQSYKIAIADDHPLYRKGVVDAILSFSEEFELVVEAKHGLELLTLLEKCDEPDLVILDINMPIKDGFETYEILKEKYPNIRVLALTVMDDDDVVARLLRLGVDGYSDKLITPDSLKNIIDWIRRGETYYPSKALGAFMRSEKRDMLRPNLSEREMEFINWVCSESDPTYKEIADRMFLSVKTIDGYRASVFEKLNLKSKAGLVRYAFENNLIRSK